jgi:hypothetical protein
MKGTRVMIDPEMLTRLRNRILFYRDSDDIVLSMAEARTILDALDALAIERDAAEARVQTLEEAWSESWDCSRDPGHRIMHAALAAEPRT